MAIVTTVALALGGVSHAGVRQQDEKPIAGLVLSGSPNDGGYYQDTAEAFKKAAKKFGYKTKIVSNVGFDTEAVVDAFGNLIEAGAVFVVGDGTMTASGEAASEENPDVPIFIQTAPVTDGIANLQGYVAQQGVGAYILGVMAPEISSSGNVGVLAGFEDPPSSQAIAGFTAGAESAGAEEVSSVVVGDYSDPVLAKAAAAAMIANGVDVIYGYLDAGLVGVSQAIEESGTDVALFSATGSKRADKERCAANDALVAQTFQGIDKQLIQTFTDFEDENLAGGNTFWGFEDPKIQRISFCAGKGDAALKDIAKSTVADLNSGEIELGSDVTGA